MSHIVRKSAGLVPWPRLFQNLRASRETELLGEYPAADVVSWIGNSVPVAMSHYAMARDRSFQKAAGFRGSISKHSGVGSEHQAKSQNSQNSQNSGNAGFVMPSDDHGAETQHAQQDSTGFEGSSKCRGNSESPQIRGHAGGHV